MLYNFYLFAIVFFFLVVVVFVSLMLLLLLLLLLLLFMIIVFVYICVCVSVCACACVHCDANAMLNMYYNNMRVDEHKSTADVTLIILVAKIVDKLMQRGLYLNFKATKQ